MNLICPKCKTEYRMGFTVCSDCGTELTRARNGKQVEINGRKLVCPICQETHFISRKTFLPSRTDILSDSDLGAKYAVSYICDGCNYVLWFAEDVL